MVSCQILFIILGLVSRYLFCNSPCVKLKKTLILFQIWMDIVFKSLGVMHSFEKFHFFFLFLIVVMCITFTRGLIVKRKMLNEKWVKTWVMVHTDLNSTDSFSNPFWIAKWQQNTYMIFRPLKIDSTGPQWRSTHNLPGGPA